MNIIAIDCGASFIKSALFRDNQLVKLKQIAAPPVKSDTDVFCCEKIESLVEIVKTCINELSVDVEECILCIDNEMHGCVLAHSDGTPYTDYISWQRELIASDNIKKLLNDSFGEEKSSQIIKHTGMPLRSGLPSSALLWLRKNGYFDRSEPLYFYTLGDYIIRRITGIAPYCHPTNAAATGLFEIETSDWNKEFISLLTNDADIVFPEIGKKSIECLFNNNKHFSVLPALGDHQAALLGSGFSKVDELSFNMGTGAQVSRLLKKIPEYSDEYQIRPYFYGMWIKTIPHVPCGRAINVIFRFLKDVISTVKPNIDDSDVWTIIKQVVDSGSLYDSNLKCDLSFFENAITDYTKGSIKNIGEYELTLDNLIKSTFRQLICNFVTVANKVNCGLIDYQTIIFSGGIAKRWSVLRNSIVENLGSSATVVLSDNDTLYGCMKYAITSKKGSYHL